MARPIRIEFQNACYHIAARGNARQPVLKSDHSRQLLLNSLLEARDRFGFLLHAYALLDDHFHLVISTPQANLSRAFGWFQTTFSLRYNRRHKSTGHVFAGRFKSHLLEPGSPQLQDVILSIHLNPITRRRYGKKVIVPAKIPALASSPWSSHADYLAGRTDKPWLDLSPLDLFGNYPARIGDILSSQFLPDPWSQVKRGLILGGPRFIEKISTLMTQKPGRQEQSWLRQHSQEQSRARAFLIGQLNPDPEIEIWARAKICGERGTDLAREKGYADGSAITHLLKRVDLRAANDPHFAQELERIGSLLQGGSPPPLAEEGLPVALL
ncbi:MAG: transposase [Verrucomicrobiae bacterium]|nr:transposase [Verrucomicrobiae bacterium]